VIIAAVLLWLKRRPCYLLTILAVAASAYAADRWFFAGLTASKWIGLPQYASAMKELQNESRDWGIAALFLEGTAVALGLPRWSVEKIMVVSGSLLSLGTELDVRREFKMSRPPFKTFLGGASSLQFCAFSGQLRSLFLALCLEFCFTGGND
jgi:hypothetical protein